MNYLPRLAPEFYRGDAVVHWTLPIAQRQTGWLTEKFHLQFREVLVHACVREQLLCPCYCLMPDHIHLLWMGLTVGSDQRKAMTFLRTYTEPLLAPCRYQAQAHDHVLGASRHTAVIFCKILCAGNWSKLLTIGLTRE
jgi:putative transposase